MVSVRMLESWTALDVLLSCHDLSIKPSPLVLDFFLHSNSVHFSHKCIVLLSLSQVDHFCFAGD